MQRKKDMAKNTVKQTKGRSANIDHGLILKKSYNDFVLGEHISKYLDIPHRLFHYESPIVRDNYLFYINKVEIELCCDNGIIESICCSQSCIYEAKELIMMNFDDFLKIIKEIPGSHEILYIPSDMHRGRNEHVYDFDNSGLQVWVWRGRIRTVYISNYGAVDN